MIQLFAILNKKTGYFLTSYKTFNCDDDGVDYQTHFTLENGGHNICTFGNKEWAEKTLSVLKDEKNKSEVLAAALKKSELKIVELKVSL